MATDNQQTETAMAAALPLDTLSAQPHRLRSREVNRSELNNGGLRSVTPAERQRWRGRAAGPRGNTHALTLDAVLFMKHSNTG